MRPGANRKPRGLPEHEGERRADDEAATARTAQERHTSVMRRFGLSRSIAALTILRPWQDQQSVHSDLGCAANWGDGPICTGAVATAPPAPASRTQSSRSLVSTPLTVSRRGNRVLQHRVRSSSGNPLLEEPAARKGFANGLARNGVESHNPENAPLNPIGVRHEVATVLTCPMTYAHLHESSSNVRGRLRARGSIAVGCRSSAERS